MEEKKKTRTVSEKKTVPAKKQTKKVVNNDKEKVVKKAKPVKEIVVTDNDTVNVKVNADKNSGKETVEQTGTRKVSFGISEVVTLLVITLVFSFGFGVILGISNYKKANYDPNLEEFIKNYDYIKENYYGEIDYKKMIKGAIAGMINNVGDENTWFIEGGNENSTFYRQLNGSYYGLGVEVYNSVDSNQIIVSKTFKNSPAEKVGLLPGDVVTKLNGMDMTNRPSTDVSTFVSNNPEATFEMEIMRNGTKMNFTLKCGNITIDSVKSKMYERSNKKIGYMQVDVFALNTYSQFKKELKSLETSGMDSLIIDLRGNSGGYFDVTKQMISLFLDSSNVIFQTEDKQGKEKIYSVGNTTKKYKIVVLVDSGSASASEVMAAALQEKYGATLIGDKTYGKGTVQQINDLATGDQYKITNKIWLTPNGKNINKVGIEPNVKVVLNAEYYKNPIEENDNQLQAAFEYLQK